MADKKRYFVNMIESNDDKMSEVLCFNFGGHHDIAEMVDRTRAAGLFHKDKHAKEFVLAMRFLHHVIKKNPDLDIFKEFGPQFEAFKQKVRESLGCTCGCGCKS